MEFRSSTTHQIFSRVLLSSVVWLIALSPIQVSAVSQSDSRRVPLFEHLGTWHHPITTTSEQAQQYFDQGLRLVYAFNHEEAIHAFEEAARLDPTAAMAYWGMALAWGPNINAPMAKDDERRAKEAIRKARTRAAGATTAEQTYIEALSKRYLSPRVVKRATLDKAYADAMRLVWRQYPNDPDAGVLFAEAAMDLRPWDFWTSEGKLKPGTEEIVATLEQVIATHPDHPGACHYYIHAVEASATPERALPCAERLPGLMPGAGHLVHMPAHIYIRLGKYHEAAERNAQAAQIDQQYLAERNLNGEYADSYYSHNLHFLWASLAMEGRRAEALKVARDLTKTISETEARTDKWKEFYLPTPIWSMIRFGQWEELLREAAPPKGIRLQQGMWHLGRGLALAATGRLPGAEGEHFALAGLAKRMGRDRTSEEKNERALLKIAERLLAGDIAVHRQKYDDAIIIFREAIKLEDTLPYSEPRFWPIPVRQYLGAVLLVAGRPGEAEAVYRADLAKNPANGWALFGLTQSLRAQQKSSEAETVERQFKAAWTYADVTLAASRF